MWSSAFWKAAIERMIRAGVAAVLGVYVGGDVVFDVFNLHTWQQVGSLFLSAAVVSLLMSLVGNAATKTGPSFNETEVVK